MKFVSKEAQNSTQQPGCTFVRSFHPRDFVQMASKEPFNYLSGLLLLLSHIVLCQTFAKLRNDIIEDSEVDNRMEKSRFC